MLGSQVPPARRALLAAARICGALAAIGWVLDLLADRWWIFDLTTHFRWHLFLVAGVALVLALLARCRGWALLAGTVVVFSAVSLRSYWSERPLPPDGERPALRIVQFNLLTTNLRRDEAALWLRDSGADLLVLEEVDDGWLEILESTLSDYELAFAAPRDDNFGLAALVRRPARGGRLSHVRADRLQLDDERPEGVPAVEIRARYADRELAIAGIHALPPVSADYAAARRRQLVGAAAWTMRARAQGRTPVVVGDLNASPFCADYELLTAAGLLDSARGFGYEGSFPAYLPAKLALPIDHVLHDQAMSVVDRSHGPNLGSDHRPLRVQLTWR